jgi:ankyrin repeat protein
MNNLILLDGNNNNNQNRHIRIDVNVVDTMHHTPLHYACRYEHLAVVQRLLQHPNIQVNAPNKHSLRTPLHLVCSQSCRTPDGTRIIKASLY